MVRRLKTYQTSLGFFDLAIAAPSMKAAADAWGLKTNEFKRGFAKETHDPAIVAATMAKPGVVLRRPVGSNSPFKQHAELPKDLPIGNVNEREVKPRRKAKEPKTPRVGDKAVREAALAFERESRSGARGRAGRKRPHVRGSAKGANRQSQRRKERLRQPSLSTKRKPKKSKPTALHSTDGRKRRTPAGRSRRRNWKPLCAGA